MDRDAGNHFSKSNLLCVSCGSECLRIGIFFFFFFFCFCFCLCRGAFFSFFFLILLWFRIWLKSEFNVGRIEVANHPSRIAGMPAS